VQVTSGSRVLRARAFAVVGLGPGAMRGSARARV
jgi:hypothetical protein